MVQDVVLRHFLFFGGPFVRQSRKICANLEEGIQKNNSVIFFKFGPVIQEEILVKDISYLELWQPLCSAEWNNLCNLGRRHHEA